MSDEYLIQAMGFVEQFGVAPALTAWAVSVIAVVSMSFALRHERRIVIHVAAAGVGGIALAANLADYFVTLSRSPDLGLEANPLWRGMVQGYGLESAKLYALSGKIMVSILAAQMFAFYLSNIERLYPRKAHTIVEFARRLGDRALDPRRRAIALFTLFAFLFSGIQPLYLYVAYLNTVEDPARAASMPSVTTATAALISILLLAFVVLTYGAFRARHRTRARGPAKVERMPSPRPAHTVERPALRRVASK